MLKLIESYKYRFPQTWSPPTPPHDDNDVYIDQTMLFLYEPTVMPESQLPPIYIKKERKKVKVEAITSELTLIYKNRS